MPCSFQVLTAAAWIVFHLPPRIACVRSPSQANRMLQHESLLRCQAPIYFASRLCWVPGQRRSQLCVGVGRAAGKLSVAGAASNEALPMLQDSALQMLRKRLSRDASEIIATDDGKQGWTADRPVRFAQAG